MINNSSHLTISNTIVKDNSEQLDTFLITNKDLKNFQKILLKEIEKICMIPISNRYLSKKEACKYLGISNNTLDTWIKMGFPKIRINGILRFDVYAIDNWLEKRV